MNSKITCIACFCSSWTSCLGWSPFTRSLNDTLLRSFHPRPNLITLVQNDTYAQFGNIDLLDHFTCSSFPLLFPTVSWDSYFSVYADSCVHALWDELELSRWKGIPILTVIISIKGGGSCIKYVTWRKIIFCVPILFNSLWISRKQIQLKQYQLK